MIRPAFYGIYEVTKASVEVYHLIEGQYHLLPANQHGRYPISPLGVELGIWQGHYQNMTAPWLRWWDNQGNLLLTGHEQVAQTEQQLEQTEQQLEHERQRTERLTALLRAQGIDPNV